MKILKPGKVEQRKFVCPKCGCIFVVSPADLERDVYGAWAICPQKGCEQNFIVHPDDGEPYEEPTQDDRERLAELFNDGKDRTNFVDFLIANGVTFREV